MGAVYSLAAFEERRTKIQEECKRKPRLSTKGNLSYITPPEIFKAIDDLITIPGLVPQIAAVVEDPRVRVEAARRLCRENFHGQEPFYFDRERRIWTRNVDLPLSYYRDIIVGLLERYLAICKELKEERTFD
ncbi:MAG TPA: hypothetical protein VJB87_03755 [Candidatus Nanoarchaeia archaeon]|nr:hypothetical protein [Candidatus Nanoarchaeia archaeon]